MACKMKRLSVSGIRITKHLQLRSYQKVTETYLQSEMIRLCFKYGDVAGQEVFFKKKTSFLSSQIT